MIILSARQGAIAPIKLRLNNLVELEKFMIQYFPSLHELKISPG